MSVMIETAEELQTLLKKLGVKVSSVEELHSLLTSINAQYNPQAARGRTAKLVAISVPCTLGVIAGVVSIILSMALEHGTLFGPYFVGALALVWGSCALVSVTALIFSLTLLFGRQTRLPAEAAPASKSSSGDERVISALPRDLSV